MVARETGQRRLHLVPKLRSPVLGHSLSTTSMVLSNATNCMLSTILSRKNEATLSISHTNRAREKGAHHQLHLHHRLRCCYPPPPHAKPLTHTRTEIESSLRSLFFITQRVKCTRHQKKKEKLNIAK